jgi:hypothetical protein
LATLIKILTDDFLNFSQYHIYLDGDVQEDALNKHLQKLSPVRPKCILKLPGSRRPEQVMWEYLNSLDHEHPFLLQNRHLGYTLRSISEEGPLSPKYSQLDERGKYKQWFKDNPQLINDVFDWWHQDNSQEIKGFVKEFISAYNWVAKRSFIPIIKNNTVEQRSGNCLQHPHP